LKYLIILCFFVPALMYAYIIGLQMQYLHPQEMNGGPIAVVLDFAAMIFYSLMAVVIANILEGHGK